MDPPQALLRWFKSTYPTLQFDPGWIRDCFAYLVETYPDHTPQQRIKAVENQLLLSDLSTSTLPPPPAAPDRQSELLFEGRQNSLIVQVLSIDEIAHSAMEHLESLKEIKEERRIREKKGLEEGEEELDEEGKVKVVTGYKRGMSKLRVGDGWREWKAIEYRMIEGFGLDDVRLGCKLQLQSVPQTKSGTLLLTTPTTTIKGHMVEEFNTHREWVWENQWRRRVGMEELPLPKGEEEAEEPVLPPQEEQPLREPDEFDDFPDDEAAEEEMRRLEEELLREQENKENVKKPAQKKIATAVVLELSDDETEELPKQVVKRRKVEMEEIILD